MSQSSALSADRVLAILELLAEEAEGEPLSRIAQQLGLPLSATHRLLGVLVGRRYARQNPVTEHYEASLTVAALGIRFLANTHLPDVCQPVLDELAERTGELVRLSVLEGDKMIWIAKAQGAKSSIRYDPASGRDVPLHATAMGKAWLATLPEEQAVRIVTAAGYDGAMGPAALTTEAALRRELRLARERGYGMVKDEAEPGISAIAMVIRDASDPGRRVVGCVSIGGPTYRMDHERLVGFLPDLQETVRRLSALWPMRTYHARNFAGAATS